MTCLSIMDLRQDGYWDQHYEEELRNFQDTGDEGDVWFGKPLTRKIIDKIFQNISDQSFPSNEITILDVGCGNCFLLSLLAEKAKHGLPETIQKRMQLHGVDYSANSIELSRKIVDSKKDLNCPIYLRQCDILDELKVKELCPNDGFDFIIDKGTFDAIRLLATDDELIVTRKYKANILSVSKLGTLFVLASCNHTEDELLEVFSAEDEKNNQYRFEKLGSIETPKISFGGKEGSQVCCLIFKLERNT